MTSGFAELIRATRAIPWASIAFKSSSAELRTFSRRSRSSRPPIMTRRALSFICSKVATWMWSSKTGKAADTRDMINLRIHADPLPAADLSGLRGIRPSHPARRIDRVHPPVGTGGSRRAEEILLSALSGVEEAPFLLKRQTFGGVARAAMRFVQSPLAVDADRQPHRRRRIPDHRH